MNRYKAYFRFDGSDVIFCIEIMGPDWGVVSDKALELAERLNVHFTYDMELLEQEWTK